MKIIVCGDLHGVWPSLNNLINREKPDIILQCGDFGWWPNFHNTNSISNNGKKWNQYGIKNGKTEIYFCDGNHEDHWSLKKYDKIMEIMPNIFYMPRGSSLVLPDGRDVLFMGGALSIDKHLRKIGVDWFPEEEISQKDIFKLDSTQKYDIVISHTAPNYFNILEKKYNIEDFSCKCLDFVLEEYKPNEWFFGHYHFFDKGKFNNTNWTCLNTCGYSNWWKDI